MTERKQTRKDTAGIRVKKNYAPPSACVINSLSAAVAWQVEMLPTWQAKVHRPYEVVYMYLYLFHEQTLNRENKIGHSREWICFFLRKLK